MNSNFEAVIGLEVHCQLATDSKIFCSCRARIPKNLSVAEIESNSSICPICAGHPGTLPSLNKKAVEFAIKAGLATQSKIQLLNTFFRKSYFYPDLPKGYQITQFDLPICENGFLNIDTKLGSKKIRIQRIHLEEDAGKNVHMDHFSLVNLNRAGIPLIEIVSHPDMQSAEEAGAYLRSLYSIVTYLEICDGNLQEGNFRCDANVSVMPKGSKEFGTRTEIKNVNSFRFVEKAIEYEIERQIQVIESGKKVIQETRTFDSVQNITVSLRVKGEANDYRYFPDPDMLPLRLDQNWVDQIKTQLPELPDQKKLRYIQDYELSAYDAGVLTASKTFAQFFEKTISILLNEKLEVSQVAKATTNLMTSEIARLMNEESIEIQNSQLVPQDLAGIVLFMLNGTISNAAAKQIIQLLWKNENHLDSNLINHPSDDKVKADVKSRVETLIDQHGLKQVSDFSELEKMIDHIMTSNPKQLADYRSGKDKLFGFFVGQVMKAMNGKANPSLLSDLLKKKLS